MRSLGDFFSRIVRVVLVLLGMSLSDVRAESPWSLQFSGTTARLRGVSMVNPEVAWASGAEGTCLRTINGGLTWDHITVPEGDKLDFRDVHASSADTACLLAIGAGEQSRIYRTTDAGATWTPTFINHNPQGFLDAFAFWDKHHGIALGDPVDGRFMILTSEDGGLTWNPIPKEGMPQALPEEGAFAASGTCLVVQGNQNVWFGTGGGATTRVFRSSDRGRTWSVHETPLPADSPTKGIFSLAFRDADHGIAVGGDYRETAKPAPYLIKTSDGGRTWRLPVTAPECTYRSAIAAPPGSKTPTWITVGPSGTEISLDDGTTWKPLNLLGYHALDFRGSPHIGWAVGERGTIAKFDLNKFTP